MASQYSNNAIIAGNLLGQLAQACNYIISWNENVSSEDFYLSSPNGMEKLAANCMLLESIGEGVKKLERLIPGFLSENKPDIPWKLIMGLRDHIAHGYFEIDASIIFDVTINEIPKLKTSFLRLQHCL